MQKGGVSPFMRFEKASGTAQGMAVWEGRAFILCDGGLCAVYDLDSRGEKPLARFPLGSYNEGTPAAEYRNHANSCMFSGIHYKGNPIPLLYVTTGTGAGYDSDGYYYRCAVENITRDSGGRYSAETVQTICYHPEGIERTRFEPPCWGCPCFMADSGAGELYIFSARYRTRRGCLPEGERNAFIITSFALPKPGAGKLIRLTPADITGQFSLPSDVMFTQGGTLHNRKIYYTFGFPRDNYPISILVFDLDQKRVSARLDGLESLFGGEEIEGCGFYNGMLLCNTCEGGIYSVSPKLLENRSGRWQDGD